MLDAKHYAKRLDLQHNVLTSVKILAYIAFVSVQHRCILAKQLEEIAGLTTDIQRLIGAWVNSDRKRLKYVDGSQDQPT
ncbi:MAG: hypothetical protein LBD17_01505 [Endomicrobium sp.]|jgi:hypothetical protein|nr:hypothetical protein [Endomicrobium sp.]